jgi:hypothetical protein
MNLEVKLSHDDLDSLRSGVPVRKAFRGVIVTVVFDRETKQEDVWESKLQREKV